MDLYLISGFLGSGKTTLIIGLSKLLMQNAYKVGVVTNDQGKYLVDTAFVNAADIPAVDVQSGCFCTHYPDLIRQLEYLQEKIDPDIVFAESIGSAANLSGTVSMPLQDSERFRVKALITLADARLLLRRVRGETLPFSDSVKAIYDTQINESDHLIISKIDLLHKSDLEDLKDRIRDYYQPVSLQYLNVFEHADLLDCYNRISRIHGTALRNAALDPKVKSAAFGRLKWFEKNVIFKDERDIHDKVVSAVEALLDKFAEQQYRIIRFKCIIRSAEGQSFSCHIGPENPDQDSWKSDLSNLHSREASMLVNARLLVPENREFDL
jgi:G3E family GTPase